MCVCACAFARVRVRVRVRVRTRACVCVCVCVCVKAGRYSIGIALPTQNWTILVFPNIGFTSQYNTNTIKKMVHEEEEEKNQKESSRLGQIDGP